MAALTAARLTESFPDGPIRTRSYKMGGAEKVYQGGLVALDASGFALAAADAANLTVVGVAQDTVDNTGADGDLSVTVAVGIFKFTATSITNSVIGTMMYVVNDQEVDEALGINGIKAGALYRRESNTEGFIVVNGLSSGQGTVLADGSDLATTQALVNDLKKLFNKYVS